MTWDRFRLLPVHTYGVTTPISDLGTPPAISRRTTSTTMLTSTALVLEVASSEVSRESSAGMNMTGKFGLGQSIPAAGGRAAAVIPSAILPP